MESQSETTQMVSALKLPVRKTKDYDLWSMRMEEYLTFTDHALWEVIVNGNSVSLVASASAEDEHLLKFHACKDAKSLWDAIKNSQEGLDKTYDRFQKLISQLEIHAAVLTKFGQVPVNAAKQSSHRAAASVSAARRVNTVASGPNVNNALPATYSYFKAHSPVRRPFNQKSTAKTNNFNEKVNTAKDQEIFNSGCSRHMIGNKSYLIDYQEIDGGFVAFRGNAKGGQITQKGGLTCLYAKATLDESNLWPRRLGHINFKTMNKLVRGNLVRGLPSKLFENDHSYVACQKEKQHKASCKTKTVSSICKPLQLLHMDLFGPISIKSINKKTYCLVVTDDFNRFSWGFFLDTKDETLEILKNFIACIENQMDHKVKTIRCDNGTEYKNKIMNEFCEMKGIRREFNVARTPQVLVIKRHNKTPYELVLVRKPTLSFMRPFRCPVIILNTLDHLGLKSLEDEVADDAGKKRDGYHALPPPYTGTFLPPKPDLVFHDAPNVNETVHTAFNVELSPTKPDIDLPFVKPVETFIPVANPKTTILKPKIHGNSRNRKACFVCKSLTHLIKDRNYYEKKMAQKHARNHAQRGNHQHYGRMTLLNPYRHAVPIVVLTKSKLVPLTAARQVTTAVFSNNVTRPRPAKIVGNPHHTLKDKVVIDSGCSRHITGNMSYLFEFEEINGGYVAFGGNPKGGKISRKGKIKKGKLDFDDVYFVKEPKFNLFSVSQMYDKKHSVVFTDTECIVLSPEFKPLDENQVLLRVPRENNMYNVDLKNNIPSKDLTCLFTNYECVIQLEPGTSTSFLKFPAIKQLAITRWDEYGFVIHPVLAPSQSALFPTSHFSLYTNLVDIPE
nr:hypothetical protein [Tanacetum cinerariifolium]